MAKRIIWSTKAERIFTEILEFYIERNGSKSFSRKLNSEILALLSILSKRPFLGMKTDITNVRVFVKKDYKIFYQIEDKSLVVLLVWDCRQSPENIRLNF
jgi:plasmid stabilization system protein ParE